MMDERAAATVMPVGGVLALTLAVSGCAGVSQMSETRVDRYDVAYQEQPGDCRGAPPSYTVMGRSYWVENMPVGHSETGTASWYGRKFHGRKTASGEIFDMYQMSAAHKTLPMFSVVKVINLENGREVVVRINDRGPFVGERLIDLSYQAARKLGMLSAGVVPVQVVVAEVPPDNELHVALSDLSGIN